MDKTSEPLIRIQARIEDAGVLADNGRYEGALLMILVAVAATSRKRYPKNTGVSDRDAFTRFLRDEMWELVKDPPDGIEFRGQKRPIEEFLYEFLRCELIHEGGVPLDLQPMHDGAVLTIDCADGSHMDFTKSFLSRVNFVVWRVTVNSYTAVKPELEGIKKRRNSH